MGLDLNKMKAKLAALKGNGGGGTSIFWKPQEGEQTIRIVPTEDGDPFKDYHFHYMNINGKNQSVMCPKRNFGEACPVCDFASNLWNEGQNGTPGAGDEAKKLFAKQRFFSPVIVRGQEDQAENFASELAERGMAVSTKKKVEPMTLKGFVREQTEAGVNIPVDLFNVFIGERAKITKE